MNDSSEAFDESEFEGVLMFDQAFFRREGEVVLKLAEVDFWRLVFVSVARRI